MMTECTSIPFRPRSPLVPLDVEALLLIDRAKTRLQGERRTILTLGLASTLFLVMSVAVMTLPPMAQIALVLGAVGVVAFFLRPADLLLAFFLGRVVLDLLWWIPGRVGSLNLMELFTGGVSGLAGVLVALELRKHERHPCMPAIIPYVVVLAFGGLRNLELRSAAEIMVRYLSPILILLLMTTLMDTRVRRRRVILALAAVAGVPIVVSLIYLARGQMNSYVLAGYARLTGGYQNLHSHALMMLCIAAMGLFHLHRAWLGRDRRRLVLFGLYVAGAMVCLYFTYVRTAQLALIAAVAAYLVVTRRTRLLLVGGVLGLVMVAGSETIQDRFKDLVLFFFPDDSVLARRKLGSGRMTIWTAAITAYFEASLGDILLGLGIGKHWLLTRGAFNPYAIAAGGYVDPHSDYLTMTFQVGPIATASYVVMQLQAVRAGVAVNRSSPDPLLREWGAFTVALMAGATVANLVSNAFINRVTVAWVLWGAAGLTFGEYLRLVDDGVIEPRGPSGIAARAWRRLRAPPRPAYQRTPWTGPTRK